jgi:hypothetical protein
MYHYFNYRLLLSVSDKEEQIVEVSDKGED